MENAQLWQRYQDWLYYDPDLNFYLDISRMRFSDQLVEEMQPQFQKAFQDLADLEAGAIANPDEDRMVGHYWLRNPDLAPNAELKAEITETLEKIKTFSAQVHSGYIHPPQETRFTDVISVGIGGSALGPQFVSQALAPLEATLNLHFIDNTDPAGIDHLLDQMRDRLATTLVLVISKSGGTPETRNGMVEVKAAYQAQNLDFGSHAVAITGKGSKLEQMATTEGWITTFPMHDWVGGRTSEMSAVGLVPAALQGIDIDAMLEGAKAMDTLTRKPELKTNPAALLSLAWYAVGNGKGEKDMVVLPYKDSLSLFSRYLQQLVMESLGKEKDLDGNTVYQGIAVYGNKGSTDQHAYVQQLREGVPNFFATFIEVLKDREGTSPEVEAGATAGDFLSGLLQGTRLALYENHRDSITITVDEVTPRTIGALIALYERAVGLYASLVNINAYHQPGVEAGKKAAASVLDLQRDVVAVLQAESGSLSLSEIAEKVNAEEKVEVIYKIIRHLHSNGRGVKVEGNWGQPSSLKVSV
ncbi:glucose-6-phosphate isomerase [Halothece sp. PCC 7418]|uniref:glucose-6-phosphate isomerase n=1 Tax=Halothece sp. (strain PCC 7418) TaxID=65093 RepID=UPI0002A06426|nr:glucose-6-phosphate isomerase [Halothece sp. PCC 7418]AFZ45678.1 glucose-6-phosphate isomerase [Halothece sp. PCC 7418]